MFDLLQNHMSTSHTIRAHAQEVWNKSDKDGGCQLGRNVVTHDSKSDLPLYCTTAIIVYTKLWIDGAVTDGKIPLDYLRIAPNNT